MPAIESACFKTSPTKLVRKESEGLGLRLLLSFADENEIRMKLEAITTASVEQFQLRLNEIPLSEPSKESKSACSYSSSNLKANSSIS
jgi:hypothetical protein